MARGTSKGDIGPNAIVVERALIKEEIDNIVEIVRGFEDELKGFNYQEFKDAPTDVQVTKRPGYTREVGLKNVFMNVLDMGNKRDRKMLKEMVMHDVIRAVGKRGKMTFDGISKGADEALPTLTFSLTASEADAERVAGELRHHRADPGRLDLRRFDLGVRHRLERRLADELLGAGLVQLAELGAADADDGDLIAKLRTHSGDPLEGATP